MSAAQSRLGIVTSLGAARRSVGRCVDSLPVSAGLFKAAGAAFAGASLLRILFSARRAAKAAPAVAAPSSAGNMGRYVLSETLLTLLLPFCRRFFLGDIRPDGSFSGGLLDRLLKNGR